MGNKEKILNLENEIARLEENPYYKDFQKIDEVMSKGTEVLRSIKRKLTLRQQLIQQERQLEEQNRVQAQPIEDDYVDDTETPESYGIQQDLTQEQKRVVNNPPRPTQRPQPIQKPVQQRPVQPVPQPAPKRNFEYAPEDIGADEEIDIPGLPDPEEL